MTVLLLGGHGMVGRATQDSFRKLRPDIELLSPDRRELDLTREESVRDYFKSRDFSTVLHCAGRVGGIQLNLSDPAGFLYDNTAMALHAIRAAADKGIRDFIYLGSSCMYPRDYKNALKEEHLLAAPLEPSNEGYALAKILGGKYCEYIHRQFGLNYKTIIPCNLFGPYDKFDPVRGHLVPSAILKLHTAKASGNPEVTIWGDGTARREFLFVPDLGDFLVQILDRLAEVPNYLNVGYGTDFSVLEYYEMVRHVVGYAGTFLFDEARPSGMKRKLLDSSHAVALGWKAKTPMLDAIQQTYRYFLQSEQSSK